MGKRIVLLASAAVLNLAAGAALAQQQSATVDTLVLTGTPYPVSLDTATTHIEVLTGETLARTAPAGLGDALNGLPGLRSSSYGPGASRPIIRGLSGPRVMILQNGTGLVDASSLSPDHAVAADPGLASRVEILRGPSALAYGGSAIGGVVNVIDERIASTRPDDGVDGAATASWDDGSSGGALAFNLKTGRGPWVFTLDGETRQSSDIRVAGAPVSAGFETAEGVTARADRRLFNTDVRLDALGAGLSWVGDDGFIGASVKRTATLYGVPFPQFVGNVPPAGEGPIAIDLVQTRYDIRGERAVGFGPFNRARFSLGYTDYQHAELDRGAGGAIGTRFFSKGTEGRIELVQPDRNGWQGAIGLQALTRDFEAVGAEAFIPPVDIAESGLFILQRYDSGTWGVEGGLRFDRRGLKAELSGQTTSAAAQGRFGPGFTWTGSADPDRAFDNYSASAAVFVRPADHWFLGLSVSRNARGPTEFELYSDGPHEGTESYQLGDPTLTSERVTSVEGTARYRSGRFRLEAHLFSADYRGFIEAVNTGIEVDDDGDPLGAPDLPLYVYAQTGARFSGGEVEAGYALIKDERGSLWLAVSADSVKGTTALGPASRVPPASYTVRLNWDGPRLDASLEVRRVEAQSRVATGAELPTAGYTVLNARLGYRPFDDRTVLFADFRNLTSEVSREHASFLKDFAPGPGRSLRLGVTTRF